MQGAFEQLSGTLTIEVGGTGAGEHDLLDVSGTATFSGGTIAFKFLDGFVPTAGQTLPFLAADGGVSLNAVAFAVSGLDPSLGYIVNTTPDGLTLSVVPEPSGILWSGALLLTGIAGRSLCRRCRVPI